LAEQLVTVLSVTVSMNEASKVERSVQELNVEVSTLGRKKF